MNPTPQNYCAMLKELELWRVLAKKLWRSRLTKGVPCRAAALEEGLQYIHKLLRNEGKRFEEMCEQLAEEANEVPA